MAKEHTAWKRPQSERYVVSVDNQAKRSFDTKKAADAEAKRIADAFPKVVVKVTDSERDGTLALEESTATSPETDSA